MTWMFASVSIYLHFSQATFLFCYFYSFVPIPVSRCGLGSCNRDDATRCLSDPSWYRHGDCFSWRHPDEDVEDVDPATHHLQFNHRCSRQSIVSTFSHIMIWRSNISNHILNTVCLFMLQGWLVWMPSPVVVWVPELWSTICPPPSLPPSSGSSWC